MRMKAFRLLRWKRKRFFRRGAESAVPWIPCPDSDGVDRVAAVGIDYKLG